MVEAEPGLEWQAAFRRSWPAYERWFHCAGDEVRPTYSESSARLKEYMPELMGTYEALTDLAGGGDVAARFLSMYCPPPYLSGCTQAAWTGDEPALVRNYDYTPSLLEGNILCSAWNRRSTIAMSDGLWGVLDGMNEDGLCLSLAFGGRLQVGPGFGIPLVLRYVLEFCEDTPAAITALCRIPVHMSYNVTVIDREQRFATVFVAPDRPPVTRQVPVATNHQGRIEWRQHARATATLEREHAVSARLANPEETLQEFVEGFLQAPVFNTEYERGFGTLYTARYCPDRAEARYLWPDDELVQRFGAFTTDTVVRSYAVDAPAL